MFALYLTVPRRCKIRFAPKHRHLYAVQDTSNGDTMVTRLSTNKKNNKAAQTVKNVVAGTLGLTGERMSKVDTAWLRMDSECNLMMIIGVWIIAC